MTLLYEQVEDIAICTPDRPAVFVDGKFFSFGELCGLAGRIASVIRDEGLEGAGAMIGLSADRQFVTYAGLLGILKSGNAYVPISPRWPDIRVREVCAHAKVSVVLVGEGSNRDLGESLIGALSDARCRIIDAGSLGSAYLAVSRANFGNCAPTADYAYLMFTTGTTGRPKGIAVTHKNVVACLDGIKGALPLFPDDRCAQMADLAFDVSIGEIFLSWTSGACIYVPTAAQKFNPFSFIDENRLTVWSSVPSVVRNLKRLGALQPKSLTNLRLSLFCGEALPCSLARAWQDAASEAMVINLYGPTETTIFATLCRWDGAQHDTGTVPIGKGIAGMTTRIERDPFSEEVFGELLLSGPQLVSGYWNDEVASYKAFVTNDEGVTWYRTGDLVTEDLRQGLFFRGRKDSQVKCRGFRVDLHEVERVVSRTTGAEYAVVVPIWNNDGLCENLVAFCDSPLVEFAAKRLCALEMPDYMVPTRIIQVPTFPLMTNGKINRKHLTHLASQLL